MDSLENALEGAIEEVKKVEENAEQAATTDETAEAPQVVTEEAAPEPAEERKVYQTKQEVLDRVKEIAHSEEAPKKDEVDYLKTVFYKLHIAEREAQLKAYIDGGGDPETYQIVPDDTEEAFKAEMGIIKEKRAKLFHEQEAEKEANLKKKLAIIEKIKSMVTSPEEANKLFPEFKALQAEWKEIKAVPAEKANELWRRSPRIRLQEEPGAEEQAL